MPDVQSPKTIQPPAGFLCRKSGRLFLLYTRRMSAARVRLSVPQG